MSTEIIDTSTGVSYLLDAASPRAATKHKKSKPKAITTMSDTEDKKPEGSEPITIRVKDQNGEETMFKVKKSTKMAKVFK